MKQNNPFMKRFVLYFRMAFFVGAVSCWLGAVLLITVAATAQEKPQGRSPKDSTPTAIRLSPEQLKGYEGYYRNPQNDEAIVRVVLVEDTLRIRPVWNTVDFQFIPSSDTVFIGPATPEGNRQVIRFVKDRQGMVRQLSPGEGPFWNKLVNYTPVEPKEMVHNPGQLKVFEGTYGSKTNASDLVQLTERDNKLILLQYWNGEEVAFVPDSTLHFFSREQRLLKLRFSREEDGSVRRMQAFNKENWEKVKTPVVSRSLLRGFEGKYRLKDDPDDLILVTAADSGLVVRQLWDGKEMVVIPLAESFFYNKERTYTLYFKKDKDGAVVAAIALDTDKFEKIKE